MMGCRFSLIPKGLDGVSCIMTRALHISLLFQSHIYDLHGIALCHCDSDSLLQHVKVTERKEQAFEI